MINIEIISFIVDAVKGWVNVVLDTLKIKEKPKKEAQEEATPNVLKTTSALADLYLTLRATVLLLAQLSQILSQPSLASLAVIALAPPPLIIGLYAITALYQSHKIIVALRCLIAPGATEKQKQQARVAVAYGLLVLTAAIAMILTNLVAPGVTNVLALSCLLAAITIKAGQYAYALFQKPPVVSQQGRHNQSLLLNEVQEQPQPKNDYQSQEKIIKPKAQPSAPILEHDALEHKIAQKDLTPPKSRGDATH